MRLPHLSVVARLLLYILTIIFAAVSLMNVIQGLFPYFVGIMCYVLAGCSLSAACLYLIKDIRSGLRERVEQAIKARPFTRRLTADYRYRTVTFAVPGLIFNVIFAAFNGILGINSHSAWFGTLSAYYLLLSVMRYWAVKYDRRTSGREQTKKQMLEEIRVYRNCGILFIVMTIALGGTVILVTHAKGGKHYPGVAIFAVAAYTFYKIIISVINLVKAGRLNSPLLMAIRHIGYADACVSLLSLQTAMFASFGSREQKFEQRMNGAAGAAVCLMVLVMGIRCIRFSAKTRSRLLEEGGMGHDSYTCGRG